MMTEFNGFLPAIRPVDFDEIDGALLCPTESWGTALECVMDEVVWENRPPFLWLKGSLGGKRIVVSLGTPTLDGGITAILALRSLYPAVPVILLGPVRACHNAEEPGQWLICREAVELVTHDVYMMSGNPTPFEKLARYPPDTDLFKRASRSLNSEGRLASCRGDIDFETHRNWIAEHYAVRVVDSRTAFLCRVIQETGGRWLALGRVEERRQEADVISPILSVIQSIAGPTL